MKNWVYFFAILCLGGNVWGQATLPSGAWREIEAPDGSEPVQRHEAAFVRVGNKFFLMGGRGMKPVNIYDAKAQTWTTGATAPIEIHHFQPVAYKNKIYVMGALTGGYPGETPIPHILIYDPKYDTWTEGPAIPEARNRGAAGVVVYKNKFYLVCGIKDGHRGEHRNFLDVFDPRTGQWTALADAPHYRDHFQAAVIGGKLYAMGGRRSKMGPEGFSDTETAVDIYDFATNTWTTGPQPLPTPRAGNYVVTLSNNIVVLGGESGSQQASHAEAEVYHTPTQSWYRLADMQQGRHGTGALVYKNKIYVASGSGNRGGGPELTSMEAWVPQP